jgi:hypothetical protein
MCLARVLSSFVSSPCATLMLLLGLLVSTASAQALPPRTGPDAVSDVAIDGSSGLFAWAAPLHRNPLQADPRVLATFLRPWLFSARLLDLDEISISGKGIPSLPKPKSYPLTPDPLSWTLSSSPDEDDYAYLSDPPRSGHPDTAQRLATMGPASHPSAARVAAKYDVSRIGNREVGEGINFYSLEKEVALGRQLSLEVEQSTRLLTDPATNEYVSRVGQLLVRHSDCKVPFVIKIVDDEEVNAFALPGGFFYVNSGLILAADDEAELAGVMAHEIAHVCARHATRNVTKGEIAQYASLPLIFFGGPVGYALRQVSSLAMPMSFLKFSRDAEREADLLGIEYQFAAGYDPTAFVDFFEKLDSESKEKHSFIARAFLTHPMNDERIRRAEATLELLPARDSYITDTSEFDEVRDRLSRMTRGRSLHGGERPHPTLRRRSGTE